MIKRFEEVVENQSKIRIVANDGVGLHFFVADVGCSCAIIESLNGKLLVHKGRAIQVSALTNTTYIESMEFLKTHVGFGGDIPIDKGRDSLNRFSSVANMLSRFDGEANNSMVDYAFKTLSAVEQSNYTIASTYMYGQPHQDV